MFTIPSPGWRMTVSYPHYCWYSLGRCIARVPCHSLFPSLPPTCSNIDIYGVFMGHSTYSFLRLAQEAIESPLAEKFISLLSPQLYDQNVPIMYALLACQIHNSIACWSVSLFLTITCLVKQKPRHVITLVVNPDFPKQIPMFSCLNQHCSPHIIYIIYH